MDLSYTFKKDLEQVKLIAPTLANSLQNLTNDALIGFGTFIDKLTVPYFTQKQLDLAFDDGNGNPSCLNGAQCSSPVAFEHVSDLTNSSDQFNNAIQRINISTNADVPEGALDAMMQATVCTDVIGWRDKSRKVLLIMTDDLVHTAGDGRVAGIVKINDAECHTDYIEEIDKYLYITSTEQDYPSLEHLRLVMRRNGIVPVFASPNVDLEYFTTVSNLLNGFVAEIESDSSDLLVAIEDAYDQVVSQVTVDFDNPNFLQTELSFQCPNDTLSSERCTDIGNDEIIINMTLTLTECTSEIKSSNGYPLEVIIPGFDSFYYIY